MADHEYLQRELSRLMRSARVDFESRQEFDQLSDVGLLVDDYLAARAKLAALADAARHLRQPLPAPMQPQAAALNSNGRLPHQSDDLGNGIAALRDSLARRGG